jgi:adenine-specific DNA-methyltransferase
VLDVDGVYADPPYTKRQYAAYYHVLETIVRNDEPEVFGKTGLREWREHASAFCYRKRCRAALIQLVQSLRCRHFFLSYSDDGHLSDEEIRSILSPFGAISVSEQGYRRYRSSARAHTRTSVCERLYCLQLA